MLAVIFPAGSELGPQQKRIVELEAAVAALHAHVAGLEEELGSRSTAAAGAAGSASEAAARAEAAEARCRQLEAEAENLGKQVALLQERLGRGEYNAATTRVLHFKYNPEVGLGLLCWWVAYSQPSMPSLQTLQPERCE